MGAVRVKLNNAGFNTIRNSPEVVALLESKAEEIRARAESNNRFHEDEGPAFYLNTVHNQSRAVTFIGTANLDGILAEVHDRALSKAIG